MVKWLRLPAVCLSKFKTNNLIWWPHKNNYRELTSSSLITMHSVDNFYPHRLHAMSCKSSLRWSLTDMVAHDSASPRIDFGRNTSAKFLNSCFSLFLLTRQRRVQTSATTGSENSLFLGNFYSSLFMRIGIFFNQYRQNINKHFFVYNIQSLFFLVCLLAI